MEEKIELAIAEATTEGFEPIRVWKHAMPFDEFYYYGNLIDRNEVFQMINEVHNSLQKMKGVGEKPVVLVGEHSADSKVQAVNARGFVIDSSIQDSGLWIRMEIVNQEVADLVLSGELRSVSVGIYSGELELAKTGEIMKGWFLNHITLTNNPLITWLNQENKFSLQKFENKLREILGIAKLEAEIKNQITETREALPKKGGDIVSIELQEKVGQLEATKLELERRISETEKQLSEKEARIAELEAQEKARLETEIDSLVEGLVLEQAIAPADVEYYKGVAKKLDFESAKELLEKQKSKKLNLVEAEKVENETQTQEEKLLAEARQRIAKNLNLKGEK